MAYPYERGEAERFVPSAFADTENPPTFWLHYGTTREKRRQQRIMDEEGLRTHSVEAIRDELLKGMQALLSPADYAEWMPRTKAYWDASDVHAKENEGVAAADVPAFDYVDEGPVTEVLNQIARDWRPYRMMLADNHELSRTMPLIALSLVVDRVENLPDLTVTKDGRYMTLDSAHDIEEALFVARPKSLPEGVPDPAAELRGECMIRMYLGKEREKNSVSPPPSPPTPKGTGTGPASANGKSKASAPSKKTPASS